MSGSQYTDLDRPPLNATRLRRDLVVPGGLWTRLDLRTETASTNSDTISAARDGAPEGLVVVADRQTNGRGRLGRAWQSPARAGLAVSVLITPGLADAEREWPAVAAARCAWLPLLAGVALVDAVHRVARLDAALKWPNDLLVDGRKCAGVLAEAIPGLPGMPVVVGIGLNVTLRAAELPHDGATSLQLAGAAATDREPLLKELLRAFARRYEGWRDAAGDAESSGLREAYVAACASLDQEVRVQLPDGSDLVGLATAIDDTGRLVVLDLAGERHAIAAGDVLHLRPNSDSQWTA